MMPAIFLIGIEVGGTFTDVTAIDETTGRVVVTNVPSERRREASAVLTGLRALGIEIGRTKRNIPALFVPTFGRPKPVVDRKSRFEVMLALAEGAEVEIRAVHNGTLGGPANR